MEAAAGVGSDSCGTPSSAHAAPSQRRRPHSVLVARSFRLLLALALLPAAFPQSCTVQQNFPSDEEAWNWVSDLEPNVPTNNTLCPGHWIWFRVVTRFPVKATALRQTGATWSLQPTAESQQHALSIALDAGYDEVNERFTSLSFLAVNGTPPKNILDSSPFGAVEYASVTHHYAPITDRETVSLGFNDTVGGSCQQVLDHYVYIGLRCTHPPGAAGPGPCTYNLTVSAIPHKLLNGVSFDGYLPPIDDTGSGQLLVGSTTPQEASRHYFRVPVSSYEALRVDIARSGDGRELFDADGSSLGVGLSGAVYATRLGDECPANGSLALDRPACMLGLNDTAPCTVGHACSSASDSPLDIVIMVEASIGADRPVTYIDAANSNYAQGCEPAASCVYVRNLVDRHGYRPAKSAIAGAQDRLPRYNDPSAYQNVLEWDTRNDNRNELRPDRGVYRLTVTKLEYIEGELLDGESRPGCVSYGQWRHFYIVTTSAADATLSVHATTTSGRGLGGVYVRQSARPTQTAYTALAERGAPASTPQRVTVSPCALNTSTTWYISVYLEERQTAISRGVPPTSFVLSVHLEDSILHPSSRALVLPRGGDKPLRPAAGLNGDGFVCCGVSKYFLVPRVPSHLSLRADLKVTSGEARAVFLKARECPRFPEDVQADQCLGKCTVSWLTTFDPYDGSAHSLQQTHARVPHGLGEGCPAACPPDLRVEGEWYVGVMALPGSEAEFELGVSFVEPPPRNDGHQCDRNAPECRAPLDLAALRSSAPRGRGAGGAAATANLLMGWAVTAGAAVALVAQVRHGGRDADARPTRA